MGTSSDFFLNYKVKSHSIEGKTLQFVNLYYKVHKLHDFISCIHFVHYKNKQTTIWLVQKNTMHCIMSRKEKLL